MFMPLYRKFPLNFSRPFDLSPWRQLDRIRITQMIVERHVAVHTLMEQKKLTAFFGLHDQPQLDHFLKNVRSSSQQLPHTF